MRNMPQNTHNLEEITIPQSILFHPDLSPRERILCGVMKELAKGEEWIKATNTELASMIGVDPQIVSNSIAKLRDLGLITVKFALAEETGVKFRQYNKGSRKVSPFRRIYLNY